LAGWQTGIKGESTENLMRVGLNLATKPLVSHRRFLVGSTLLGIFASVLFIFLAWHFYSLRKADEDFRAHLGKIQQQMEHLQEQRSELERFYAKEENHHLQGHRGPQF
jgi:hypothetical protein